MSKPEKAVKVERTEPTPIPTKSFVYKEPDWAKDNCVDPKTGIRLRTWRRQQLSLMAKGQP